MARIAKKYSHRDKRVDAEFSNVFTSLSRLDMGPFRFFYDAATNMLYLQYKSSGSQYYQSVMSISSTGAFVTEGTHTASTPITDVGRS